MVNSTLQLFYHKETNLEKLRQAHPALSFCFSVFFAWNPLSRGIRMACSDSWHQCRLLRGTDCPLWSGRSMHTSQSLWVLALASFLFPALSSQRLTLWSFWGVQCPGCRGQQGLHVWDSTLDMSSAAHAEGAAGLHPGAGLYPGPWACGLDQGKEGERKDSWEAGGEAQAVGSSGQKRKVEGFFSFLQHWNGAGRVKWKPDKGKRVKVGKNILISQSFDEWDVLVITLQVSIWGKNLQK